MPSGGRTLPPKPSNHPQPLECHLWVQLTGSKESWDHTYFDTLGVVQHFAQPVISQGVSTPHGGQLSDRTTHLLHVNAAPRSTPDVHVTKRQQIWDQTQWWISTSPKWPSISKTLHLCCSSPLTCSRVLTSLGWKIAFPWRPSRKTCDIRPSVAYTSLGFTGPATLKAPALALHSNCLPKSLAATYLDDCISNCVTAHQP